MWGRPCFNTSGFYQRRDRALRLKSRSLLKSSGEDLAPAAPALSYTESVLFTSECKQFDLGLL